MAPRTTLELIDITKPMRRSYPIDSLVEVVYDLPANSRKLTYLGLVAVRPEDKASSPAVTSKYGDERIIPVAATYTLKTISKQIHDCVDLGDGLEIVETSDCLHPADFIFDPTNPDITVTRLVGPESNR